MASRFHSLSAGATRQRAEHARPGGEVSPVEPEDEEFWAPFLAYRPGDRRAERLRTHAREDARRRQQHPPRRAAALSREEIVRAALNVADAEGPDAINMRRIARELHSGTMSLYWHIRSKEELLDLMIDAIIGEPEVPEPSGDWRADLRAIARSTRDTLHRHQRAVNTYVLGAVLRELQEMNGEHYMAEVFAGLSEPEKQALIREFTERIRGAGQFPHLVAMLAEGIDPDAPETRDERFEFGLDCLLDGIVARLSPGARTPPPA